MSSTHTALITGASKGIGLESAKRLVQAGVQVIGCARSEKPGDFPGEYHSIDLSKEKERGELFEELAGKHSIDIVVNNVGLVKPAPLGEIALEDFDAVMDLNLRVAIQATQAALPAMIEAGWGRVVNIASLVVSGVPFRSSYAVAKSGLVSLTKSWALELAAKGITVNAVSPGPTDTELFGTNNPPGSESRKRYEAMVPMHRVAHPREIAAVVGFLASEEASFVTGQNIYADGGASTGPAPQE